MKVLRLFRRHRRLDRALQPYGVGLATRLALHTRDKGTALRSTHLRLVPVLVDDVMGEQVHVAASRPATPDEALNRARERCEAARWPEQHPDECLWCQYVMATRPTLFTALPDDAA